MEEADLPIERAPTRCQSRFLTLMLENVNGPKLSSGRLSDRRGEALQNCLSLQVQNVDRR